MVDLLEARERQALWETQVRQVVQERQEMVDLLEAREPPDLQVIPVQQDLLELLDL